MQISRVFLNEIKRIKGRIVALEWTNKIRRGGLDSVVTLNNPNYTVTDPGHFFLKVVAMPKKMHFGISKIVKTRPICELFKNSTKKTKI